MALFSHTLTPYKEGSRVVMRAVIPREKDGLTFSKQAFFLLPVKLSDKVRESVEGKPGPAMVALLDWALAQLEANGQTLIVEEKP